jgi:hypothetical protein
MDLRKGFLYIFDSFLSLQNAMLAEMAEEWEQCENKLKESLTWVEKSRSNLNALSNRKRPIRDQLSLRERTQGEMSVQRTKVVMAVEKLKVHFDSFRTNGHHTNSDSSEISWDGVERDVNVLGRMIESDLDTLQGEIRAQNSELEQCLTQLGQYQQVRVHYLLCFQKILNLKDLD